MSCSGNRWEFCWLLREFTQCRGVFPGATRLISRSSQFPRWVCELLSDNQIQRPVRSSPARSFIQG